MANGFSSEEGMALTIRPRVVLWLGPAFDPNPELVADVDRLGLVAVYQETRDASIESALRSTMPMNSRFAYGMSTADEVAAWDPESLPVFYLRGREGESQQGMREQHSRWAMLERLDVIAARHRPSIIALGMDGSKEGLRTLLTAAAEFGRMAPVVIVGNEATLEQEIAAVLDEATTPVVEPRTVVGSWADLKAQLVQAGIPLFLDETERPAVRVGDVTVALGDVWDNPELRIDHTWRILTTRALNIVPAKLPYSSLFDAVMRLDEARDASTADDDFKEWWAILEGVTVERPGLTRAVVDLVKELEAIGKRDYRDPRTCWIAAEPGSGSTIFLHTLALRAAQAGFPVLVAKQMVRSPSTRQLMDFLTELDRRARDISAAAGQKHVEHPILVVLDVTHEAIGEFEDLADELVRVGGRHVLTLRAVRLAPGSREAPGSRVGTWLAEHIGDDTDRRLPKSDEPVLAILRSRPSDAEIESVERKATWLRRERGLHLSDRTSASWHEFLNRHRYRVETLLRNSGLREGSDEWNEATASFAPDVMFWILLHHFLTTAGEEHGDPLAGAIRRRVAWLPDLAMRIGIRRSEATGIFLETVKVSAWSLPIPVSALSDFIRSLRAAETTDGFQVCADEGQATGEPVSGSPAPTQMEEFVKRLQDWAAGRAPSVRKLEEASPELVAYPVVDYLVDEHLLRKHSVRGVTYVSVPHPLLARQILLDALDPAQSVWTDFQRESIGGVEAIFTREKAFGGLQTLLGSLKVSMANIRFCELLSENLLHGTDDSPEWQDGRGEQRRNAYGLIPADIRHKSRVLSHHWANIQRRSTFFDGIGTDEKLDRLRDAANELEHALSLPWAFGERSDHPSFLHTTLGLVHERIAQLQPGEGQTERESARKAYRAALTDMPESRHTRLALARLCVSDARRKVGRQDTIKEAAGLAAEALRLLSVEPTGHLAKWYQMKFEAEKVFGDDRGRQFIENLCSDGVEEGFLLKVELMIHHAADGREAAEHTAIEFLEPLVYGSEAAARPRVCRRLAELMHQDSEYSLRFEERYRLLSVVEIGAERLTPHEEYQLAYLAYQLGNYEEGRRRFSVLRSTARSSLVAGLERPILLDAETQEPLDCQATVRDIEGERGWMQLEDRKTRRPLFQAPFVARHFSEDVRARKVYRAIVRIEPTGPKAVAPEFAKRRG